MISHSGGKEAALAQTGGEALHNCIPVRKQDKAQFSAKSLNTKL